MEANGLFDGSPPAVDFVAMARAQHDNSELTHILFSPSSSSFNLSKIPLTLQLFVTLLLSVAVFDTLHSCSHPGI